MAFRNFKVFSTVSSLSFNLIPSFMPKMWIRSLLYSMHCSSICCTVNGALQVSHTGRVFSVKSLLCVNLQWPIRSLVKITSSLLLFLEEDFHFPRTGLIVRNLFEVEVAVQFCWALMCIDFFTALKAFFSEASMLLCRSCPSQGGWRVQSWLIWGRFRSREAKNFSHLAPNGRI